MDPGRLWWSFHMQHNYIIAKHRRALFCPYFWATSLRTLYLILLSKHLSFLFSRNLIKEATLLAATVVFCTWDNALGETGNTYPYCRKCVDTFSLFAVGTAMFTKPGGTSYPPSTKRTAWTCSREIFRIYSSPRLSFCICNSHISLTRWLTCGPGIHVSVKQSHPIYTQTNQ